MYFIWRRDTTAKGTIKNTSPYVVHCTQNVFHKQLNSCIKYHDLNIIRKLNLELSLVYHITIWNLLMRERERGREYGRERARGRERQTKRSWTAGNNPQPLSDHSLLGGCSINTDRQTGHWRRVSLPPGHSLLGGCRVNTDRQTGHWRQAGNHHHPQVTLC